MSLKVIGAGLGRTGTMSLKLALEHIKFGPCYHMSEVMAGARRNLPLWLDVIAGKPAWDTIFDGFASTVDYPTANYWRELVEHFPEAKVILTVRDPNAWFDSVSQTIFSPEHRAAFGTAPISTFMQGAVTRDFGDRIDDRAWMVDYFARRNEEIIAALPRERLLVLPVGAGWEPLCTFLGVDVPAEPYPSVNSHSEFGATGANDPDYQPSSEEVEAFGRYFIDTMRSRAFGDQTAGNP